MTKLIVAFRNFSNAPNKAFILAYRSLRNVDGDTNILKASSSLPLCYSPSPAPAYVNKSKMLVASKGITWLWLSTTLPPEWLTTWLAIVEVLWSGGCVNIETCRRLMHDAFFCDLIVAVLMFRCTFRLLISCNWGACPYPPIPPTVFLTCRWSVRLRLERFNYCALNVADIWNNYMLYHAEPCGCLYRGLDVSSQQLLVIVKFPVDSLAQRMSQAWAPILMTCLGLARRLLRVFYYDIVQLGRYGSFGGTCYVYVQGRKQVCTKCW